MKKQLNVEGMHCESCATIIKEDLKDLGASKVEVSLKENRVTVEFDEKKVGIDKIKEAIEKEGYKVRK